DYFCQIWDIGNHWVF
nr:immunoglobulin light chain junction region [Macaca mulatta]